MKTAADDPTRELLQQRFDEIDDALRDGVAQNLWQGLSGLEPCLFLAPLETCRPY
jgi:hypothetical protein